MGLRRQLSVVEVGSLFLWQWGILLQARHTSQSLHTPNLLPTIFLEWYNFPMLHFYTLTLLQLYKFNLLQCSNVTSSPHEPILAHPPSWFQHFLQYCFKTVVNLFLKTEAHYRSMNHCTDPTYSLNMF